MTAAWGQQIGSGTQGSGGTYAAPNAYSNFDLNEAMFGRANQQLGYANQKDLANIQGGYSLQQAQIGADASKFPAMMQQNRFNKVFPWLTGQAGAIGNNAGDFGNGGPQIHTGGILNPQQIQQQVNAARAGNDQTTESQQQTQRQQLGGRGFGSNSPLLQALYGQSNASNLATNTANERDIRLGAAQKNASQLLATQGKAADVYGQRQAEKLQARGQDKQSYSALLAALSGIV